jgi:hypothetical protein
MFTKLVFTILVITAASLSQAFSQIQNSSSATGKSWFDKIIGIENTGVINGTEYKMEKLGASTHPFLLSGETNGQVHYQGDVFDVPVLYDIYKDELVVKYFSESGRVWFILLDKTQVQEFVISAHLFKNFDRGFHEVIFQGNDFLLLSKRAKISQMRNRIFNYAQNDRYFFVESDRWKPVSGKAGFLKMLGSKEDKRELKLFIRKNHIKIRRFRNDDMVKVASFINSLRSKR